MRTPAYNDAQLAVSVGTSTATNAALAATGTVTGASKAVAGLLSAAGATAAVPYAGWIAAGVMTVAASIIAVVSYAKRRTLKVNQVIQITTQLGFPQGAAFPNFILDALNEGKWWRYRQAEKIEKDLAKGKGKTWELTAKLQFLGIVEAMDQAEKRRAMGLPPVAPTPEMVAMLEGRSQSIQAGIQAQKQNRQLILLGGGLAVLVVVVALTKPRKR